MYTNDLKGTNVVSKFLENNFYSNLDYFLEYNLITEKALQLKGIDCKVILKDSSEVLLIDEKCALSYNNIADLKTYALELSFINKKGKLVNGWFLDDTKTTTHYLFCWLDKANKNNKDLILSDIYKVEVMLVSKDSILNYLKNKLNLNIDVLCVLDNGMRNLNKKKLVLNKNVHLSYSSRFREKPINLILNKDILRSLSCMNVKIPSNSY